MGNIPLLLFSSLLVALALLYFKRQWPDLDVIDIFIIFVVLYFGVYPFIRGLYVGKGVVYDSANNNPGAIGLLYLQVILITVVIRVVSLYLPDHIKSYVKLKTLVEQWARVDKTVVFLLSGLLILFQLFSYYKYGVKSHILPGDFARIGKELPYWLTSGRTIYNYLTLSVVIVFASKASLSKKLTRYYWIAAIILFLPFVGYFGRKGFVNAVVMAALLWLINNEKKLFQIKNLAIIASLVLAFFIASNLYQTYRSNLQVVGVSLLRLENPITSALNFKETLKNLGERAGTWEFNYLVIDRQMRDLGTGMTNGKLTREGLKCATPRILWPGKKFQTPPEILAEAFHAPQIDVSFGTNLFGIAQADFGYLAMVTVPLTILLIVIIMASLMKVTFNHPVFFWFLSIAILYPLVNIEENGPEIFYMLRNIIAIMTLFLSYLLVNKIIIKWKFKSPVT
jgi:hypothetical protein